MIFMLNDFDNFGFFISKVKTVKIFFKLVFTFAFLAFAACSNHGDLKSFEKEKSSDKMAPWEYLGMMRSYPDFKFDEAHYVEMLRNISMMSKARAKTDPGGFDADWKLEGPTNIGGRINTIAVDTINKGTFYVGCASGGIFKTTNSGNDWIPVFDDQPYLAIGDIVINPKDPKVIYAGTGDPNISAYPFLGDGVYKSLDAGETWKNMGLQKESIVSKLLIDPSDTSIVYAATMGKPMENNNYRGLYKSTDGGKNWQQILFVSDSSGVIDMMLGINNPKVIYASTWDRFRTDQVSIVSGSDCGIWKSINGGKNWNKIDSGLPNGNMGRINLAQSFQDSNLLYASVIDSNSELEGIYRSTNGGQSWSKVASQNKAGLPPQPLGDFGWYFGDLAVNPYNDQEVQLLGIELWKNTDIMNNNWQINNPPWYNYEVHADKHDLAYLDKNAFLLATDGGLYVTGDGGDHYNDFDEIPNTQFYHIAISPFLGDYWGGAQDNGTCKSGSSISDWERVFGGDGFQMIFDPVDSRISYVETQNGNIVAIDLGIPQSLVAGIDTIDRMNWDMPYIMSSHDHQVLYTGTQRVYKMENAPNSYWQPISGDLTDGNIYGAIFHTISTLSESKFDPDILYVGTSDGNVWKTDDGGSQWHKITDTLPNRYVTSVKASVRDSQTVFVTHSGFKSNDFTSHIHKSEDLGNTWIDISGDLPAIPVNDFLEYPYEDSVYFVATDAGVYGTNDGGKEWVRVGKNMPVVAVYDIEIDSINFRLVAGTFARSMMSFPLDSILKKPEHHTSITENNFQVNFNLYPNPASDHLNMELCDQNIKHGRVEIVDLTGKILYNYHVDDLNKTINISNLSTGIYLLHLHTPSGDKTQRFIKF